LAFPSIVYVAAMTIFLFRPPDLFSFYADRIAFGILVFFVALRTMALRDKIPFFAGLSLPMLSLMALAVFRALQEPFDAQTWSIVASKYIVPFALFHIAVLVFRGAAQRRHFEVFVILALAYLVFIAIAFLADARSLIFPRFILDESLGFHPDRARGPFLQAVANGVSLNILGILAVALPQKRKAVVWLLWLVLPLAVLATMTRAVWISFAVSTLVLGFLMVERRLQAVCALLAVAGLMVGLAIGLSTHSLKAALWDRTGERGPVEARLAVYDAGWAMFKERPFSGWAAAGMYAELARRMQGYHLRTFYVHNTYLALLVEFGVPGLALYGILFFNLFRLGWHGSPGESGSVASLRKVWPILLCVYLFNAFFVDMAYQFVIGLMFTVAGMLCASEESIA
jgi:O-antigen ligase